MSKKLFIGGLSGDTTEGSLRAAFEPFGQVEDAQVIVHAESGRSRGFGFVSLTDPAAALAARSAMNGGLIDGRTVRVDAAQEPYHAVVQLEEGADPCQPSR